MKKPDLFLNHGLIGSVDLSRVEFQTKVLDTLLEECELDPPEVAELIDIRDLLQGILDAAADQMAEAA
jgi:hypothetical protein